MNSENKDCLYIVWANVVCAITHSQNFYKEFKNKDCSLAVWANVVRTATLQKNSYRKF